LEACFKKRRLEAENFVMCPSLGGETPSSSLESFSR
jgi:hypothetical protein